MANKLCIEGLADCGGPLAAPGTCEVCHDCAVEYERLVREGKLKLIGGKLMLVVDEAPTAEDVQRVLEHSAVTFGVGGFFSEVLPEDVKILDFGYRGQPDFEPDDDGDYLDRKLSRG